MTVYINGEILDVSLIEAEIGRLKPHYEQAFADQPADQREKQLAEWARENVIEAVLFRQQSRVEFPQISDQQIDSALEQLTKDQDPNSPINQRLNAGQEERAKLRQEVADQIRHEALTQKITANLPKPKEKAIANFYKKNVERFTIPEMVHAAHIVKHPGRGLEPDGLKAAIDEIYQQLESGTPFEELANQNSDCPGNAGSLGFFARGQMVQAFEDVAFSLAEGQYSKPFESEFGWHIAKVYKKQPASICPLDQVKQVIVRDLTEEAKQKALESYLDDLRAKAVIEEK